MNKETLDFLFNFIGTSGVIFILIAYWLLQIDKIKSNDLPYYLINLVGAILIMISLLRFWNLASFLIEVCWILISLYGIYKYYKRKLQ